MHVVTFSERVRVMGVELEPNVGYLVNNTGAGSLLTNRMLVKCADGHHRPLYRLTTVVPFGSAPLKHGADYNGRTIWLLRGGGFGDLLMITPTIREIKRRWPQSRVVFVTMPEYAPVLRDAGCDEVISGFVSMDRIGVEDAVVSFEGAIEDNPDSHVLHAIPQLARHAGLRGSGVPGRPGSQAELSSLSIGYQVTEAERSFAVAKFPRTGRRRVGIQATASSAVRTYPAPLLVDVINDLVARDIEVFVFGKPNEVDCALAGVTNLADQALTFRQSAAVMSTCDVMLVPDSGLLHVAQALGIPTVALFASFDASLRVIPGAPVKVLQAKADCAPCHWHESAGAPFPAGGPCNVAGFCTVLASIAPARVVAAVEFSLARNWLNRADQIPIEGEGGWELDRSLSALRVDGDPDAATGEIRDVAIGQAFTYLDPLPKGAHLAAAKIRPEVVIYDFLDHKIGDTCAAVYLLGLWRQCNPDARLEVVDRGALEVRKYWPMLATGYWAEFVDVMKPLRRLNFEFGNLWISAPSAWRDCGRAHSRFSWSARNEIEEGPRYDVGIHCLTDAEYNVKRNHDLAQFALLCNRLEQDHKLKIYWVPAGEDRRPLSEVIDNLRRCRMWIGGDTGLSHLFAMLHPNRPLVAIYSDDSNDRAAFEHERTKIRAWWNREGGPASSPWCSDPLSRNLHKFVMPGETHQFDLEAVVARVLELHNSYGKRK